MWSAILAAGLASQAPDAAPARLIPPVPPADIAALVAMDSATDAAAAKRMLAENGVPADKRAAAAADGTARRTRDARRRPRIGMSGTIPADPVRAPGRASGRGC